MAELTDEQIACEEEFLSGMPPLNVGALFLPPIWGPAHGMWATILFYPIWLFADNTFYAAFTERTPLAIGIALIVLLTLTVGTVAVSYTHLDVYKRQDSRCGARVAPLIMQPARTPVFLCLNRGVRGGQGGRKRTRGKPMGFVELLLLAIGLSMDAFAVSVCKGLRCV